MRIKDKLLMEREQLEKEGPITIAAFGDSVTHGSFATGEMDFDAVYWNLLKEKLYKIRKYVPINVINAGIGGIRASASVQRMESQVLCHRPDLIIICFGLNDVNGTLEEYLDALRTIFTECRACGAEVIFMTPNMLNTYVSEDTEAQFLEYAAVTAEYQNSGKMDAFMEAAVTLAGELRVNVCDCYKKWKELSKTTDTTKLLANRINHPSREMHHLFADALFEMIMED